MSSLQAIVPVNFGPFHCGKSTDQKTIDMLKAAAKVNATSKYSAKHWDYGKTENQFIKDVPEAVWDVHILPYLGLKGVCCANRTSHMFREMWQYHICEKLIPLCVPQDVPTLCRAKDIIKYMLNQRNSSIVYSSSEEDEDEDEDQDEQDQEKEKEEDGNGTEKSSSEEEEDEESDTPPVDIILNEGVFLCDEIDLDVNGKQCRTVLLDFPIHIAGKGMGKSTIDGMIKVSGNVNSSERVILKDLTIGGDTEFGLKSVTGLPIKLERIEVRDCKDAGLWMEKCNTNRAAPFELIECNIHHNRVGFATRKMSGSIRNSRFHSNNYGLMVGTHCLTHIRGQSTQFFQNQEMNCVTK